MTIEELKAEAAKLSAGDRYALASWIEHNDDVQALRQDELIHDIHHGLEQAERGELIEPEEVFAQLRQLQNGDA